jgi:predicted membrane channel-forming protein YqfA (hemolysin III family)
VFKQVDESLREPGIYYGYRPEVSSWMECCHSLFTANNETLNFWTHFFPTVFFIWRTVQLAGQWNSKDDLHSAEYAQSFMAYMMTAILYPCMSAVAHGFSALSHRARAVLFFMDYAAINFYAYGSALLYRSYVLPDTWMENETGTNIYLTVCFSLSLASTALTCTSRAFVRDVVAQRLMRLAAFTLPYIWVSIPLFARLVNCFGFDESTSCPTPDTLRATKYHLCQVIVALMASFCYASHLPERVMPGTFDYVGHSHNLLHICGVTATLFQMEGALLDMEVRRSFLTQNHLAMVDPYWNFWVPVILLGGHVLLIAGFGLYIYWNEAATVECEKKKFKCH